jgi:tRNA dimethylallyltransferase
VTAPLLPSLVGATGAGKTRLAVLVAQRLDLEIVSADSRQVYRRFDVGTAKPSPAERAAAPHHLVDVADPEETYTAARFGREARDAFERIRARGRTPFLVGGSGLYLRAAEEGLFEGPEADPELRARLAAEAREKGVAALHARLSEVDPDAAGRLHRNDRVRIVRALEVWELTGVTLSEHHRRHREAMPRVRRLRFGLAWPASLLERRIERRVDAMLAAGWEAEVRRLLDDGFGDAPAMNALGYPEVCALVEGKVGAAEARERIVRATRQFAKRQRTWFRAVEGVEWLEVRSEGDVTAAADRMTEAIAAAAR